MQTVYIIMNCNQWKENANARMIAATTDEETMYGGYRRRNQGGQYGL
jgi:hypothetical protein